MHRTRSRRGARTSPIIHIWVHRKADTDIRIQVSTADVSSICIVAEAQDTAHTGTKTHATDQAACAGKQAGTTAWRLVQYRHIPSLPVGSNLILPNPDHRDTKRKSIYLLTLCGKRTAIYNRSLRLSTAKPQCRLQHTSPHMTKQQPTLKHHCQCRLDCLAQYSTGRRNPNQQRTGPSTIISNSTEYIPSKPATPTPPFRSGRVRDRN